MNNYTFNQYSREANKFIRYDVEKPFNYLLPALAEEVGELQGIFAKHFRKHGDYFLSPDQLADVVKELGDILWNVNALAYELGFTLEEVADYNILKLATRKAKGTLTDVVREG